MDPTSSSAVHSTVHMHVMIMMIQGNEIVSPKWPGFIYWASYSSDNYSSRRFMSKVVIRNQHTVCYGCFWCVVIYSHFNLPLWNSKRFVDDLYSELMRPSIYLFALNFKHLEGVRGWRPRRRCVTSDLRSWQSPLPTIACVERGETPVVVKANWDLVCCCGFLPPTALPPPSKYHSISAPGQMVYVTAIFETGRYVSLAGFSSRIRSDCWLAGCQVDWIVCSERTNGTEVQDI